jgi:hypothetical protein
VILRRLAPLAAAAVLLAGCGGGAGARDATLWVTRDAGSTVLRERSVRSNLTAAQALESAAKVKTAYSGAFVQAIDGLAGNGSSDWFFYVNGYLAATGATDYLLHTGDVEWWDYRHWAGTADVQLVAGAFPEPFLHGFGGKRRDAAVRFGPGEREVAVALAREVGAARALPLGAAVPARANLLVVRGGAPRLAIRWRAGHGSPGDPVEVDADGAVAAALARDPHAYAHRFAIP